MTTKVPTSMTTGVVSSPAFAAYQSVAQAAVGAGAYTKISLQTEEFDNTNAFDSVTNYTFTPQVAGYYLFIGSLMLNGTTTGVTAAIYKNGTVLKRGEFLNTGAAAPQVTVSSIVYMNGSTDYVDLRGYSDVSLVTVAGQSLTYFNGILVVPV